MDTEVAPSPAITPETEVVGAGPVATVHAIGGSAFKVFRDGRTPGEPPPGHSAVVAETGRGTVAGADGGEQAYVASALARRSLEALVEDVSKRSWHETAVLGVRLAGALAAAHDAGIVHGGVKPSNVLVTDDHDDATASACLGDFAHGSWEVAASGESPDRSALGFCAPEVLEGAEPGVASDVYSLGATLLYAVSGEVPFAPAPGETLMRTLRRIMSEPVADVRPLRVPDDLASVLEKAMAKDPAARFASAAAMGEALQDVQRGHGHTVTPLDSGAPDADAEGDVADVTSPELTTTPAPVKRSTTGRTWALGVLVVCALLAVVVVVVLAVRSQPPQPGESVAATQAPPTAASTPPTTAPPGTAAADAGALPKGADDSVFRDVPGFHLTDQAEDSVVSDPALAESIFQKANLALVRTDDGREVGAFLVLVLQDRIADDPDALTKIVEAIAPDPPQPPETTEIAGQPMIETTTPDGLTAIAAQDPTGLLVGILRGKDKDLMEQFLTALGELAQ